MLNNENYLDVIPSTYLFQMIKGNFEIMNGTIVSNQSAIVDSFSSTLLISDSTFIAISMSQSSIKVTGSAFKMSGSTASSITRNGSTSRPFVIGSLESSMSIERVTFTENTVPFLTVLSSELNITGVTLSNIVTQDYVINIDEG